MGDILSSVGGFLFGKEGKSKQQSTSASTSGNYAYPYLNQAVSPAVNYLTQGGGLLGDLLGITSSPSGSSGGGSPVATSTAPAPTVHNLPTGPASDYGGPSFMDILGMKHKGSAYKNAFNTYYNYYSAHPNENPGINSRNLIDQLSGDDIKNSENRLRGLYDRWNSTDHLPVAPVVTPTAPTSPSGPVSQNAALENFANSAGMQFLREQGIKGINADKSAKGLLQSGSTGTALDRFNTGLASTYLNQYLQNVFDYSRLGLGAGGLLASAGSYSNSTGQSTGKSNQGKEGLIPGILMASASAGGGGGGA